MGEPQRFTLEQLASATGMTPRNVRAYQTRGLISPPERDGRRSVYGRRHLGELMAVQRARAEGATLGLISGHLASGRRLDGGASWVGHVGAVAGRRHPRRTDLGRALPVVPDDRGAAELVEQLTAEGIVTTHRGRPVISADLAAGLNSLLRRGLPVTAALGLVLQASRATASLVAALREVLGDGGGRLRPADAALVADLLVAVVREVLSTQFGPGA